MGNATKLLALIILIILTSSYGLTNSERDTIQDLWEASSQYDYSSPAPDNRVNCEGTEIYDDCDTQFLNEEPKLYSALEFTKKQTGVSADTHSTVSGPSSINPFLETLLERTDLPSETPFLATYFLRAPPSFPA